jgi:phosphinothricin acetyltransferase
MTSRIRLAEPDDGAAIAAIYRPAVTHAVISFEIEPPNAGEMTARVSKTVAHLPWLVCDSPDGVLGYAYASRYRDRAAYQWSAEVSAYVREDVRRAGIARALYTSLFAVLTLQGFRNALAGITLPNEASVGLHRAIGFTPVGVYRGVGFKMGAWHDVGWFERGLLPRDDNPNPPVPLPQLIGSPAFSDALAAGQSTLRAPLA